MAAGMHVVCGAGLAGLSLAVQLTRAGVRDEIVLVDRRTTFGRDRTWCTWGGDRTPWLALARASWSRWEVVTGTRRAVGGSERRPYVMLDSRDVYAAALEELDAAPNVTLRLGEPVTAIGDGWAQTGRERLEGHVYDALALGSPALRGFAPELWQAFLGWEVTTQRPVFSPGVATLMDFRCAPGPDGVAFVYVLPFAPDRALVEHTSFGRTGVAAEARRAALRAFLADRIGAGEVEVVHEERGRIPMTRRSLPMRRSPATTAIGTGGGAVRASSGYAFSRIQRQAAAVAPAVVEDGPVPARAGARRHAAMDAVFLEALRRTPEAFPGLFADLVQRLSGEAFARFMTDGSGVLDEARVVAAAPTIPFARAAVSQARLKR